MAIDPLAKVADWGSTFPGNSGGSTTLPAFPGGEAQDVGAETVSWTDWLKDIGSTVYRTAVSPLSSAMPAATVIAANASESAKGIINKAQDAVTGAATGIGGFVTSVRDTVKYLAWALIAVALIYVLVVFVVPVTAAVGRK